MRARWCAPPSDVPPSRPIGPLSSPLLSPRFLLGSCLPVTRRRRVKPATGRSARSRRCRTGLAVTAADRRCTGPATGRVRPNESADRDDEAEEDPIDPRGRRADALAGMAQGEMRDVKERRPAARAGIDDGENALQVLIEIACGLRLALEHQRLIASVPPAMPHAARNECPFARTECD